MPHRQEAPHSGRQRPRRRRLPGELLPEDMSNTISPRALEEQLDKVSNNELNWQEGPAGLLDATSSARSTRSRTCASTQVLDALNELLGAAHLPGPRRRRRPSRQCPTCGTGKLSLKARQVRRLHRLLELSGMHATPGSTAGPDGGRRQQTTRCSAPIRTRVSTSTLRWRALRHLSAARRTGQGRKAAEGLERPEAAAA